MNRHQTEALRPACRSQKKDVGLMIFFSFHFVTDLRRRRRRRRGRRRRRFVYFVVFVPVD